MRGDFETMVAHILPHCPVTKKRTAGSKRDHADISVTFTEGESANISSFGSKSGVGKTEVHLRFHKHKEYQTLNNDQKAELKDWREKEVAAGRGGKSGEHLTRKKGKDNSSEKHINSRIDAAVAKKLAARAQAENDKKSDEAAADSYIVSAFERMIGKKVAPPASSRQITAGATNAQKTSILKTILGRAKNRPPQDDVE
jgi:hypothetical protein